MRVGGPEPGHRQSHLVFPGGTPRHLGLRRGANHGALRPDAKSEDSRYHRDQQVAGKRRDGIIAGQRPRASSPRIQGRT